jgi:hypothetical protein
VIAGIRLLRRRGYAMRQAEVAAAFLLLVAQAGAASVVGYYQYNRQVLTMTREWDVLRVFRRHGDDYDYYLYTGPFMLADAPVFRLFSAGTRAVSGFSETDLPDRLPRDAAFVLTPEFRGLGVEITERFPGAERQESVERGVQQMIVYLCSERNGCRGDRS